MPQPIGNDARYMPGLDGLRAIAVLAVIAYHLGLGWARGGLLGVGMFFVLSGYLITDLLIAQRRRNGRLDLKNFVLRRARRLLPAMLLMVAAVLLGMLLAAPDRIAALQAELAADLLFVSNWWLIYHDVSYFESFGPASPFGHFWSLAVEEQFYLLWPLILLICIRITPTRAKLAGLIAGLAVVSALGMALLYEPGADPSRIYYGTDTRAFGLLIGAVLAILLPSWKLALMRKSRKTVRLDFVGGAGLLIILAMMAFADEYSSLLYQGGLVMFSLLTALVIAAAAHPHARIGAVLGSKPLRWLGVRSYGIYLWHYPIIVLTTPTIDGPTDWLRNALQIAVVVGLAECSWRFVEEPIRRGALSRIWKQFRTNAALSKRSLRRTGIGALTAVIVLSLMLIGAAKIIPTHAAASDLSENHSGIDVKPGLDDILPPPPIEPKPSPPPQSTPLPQATPEPSSPPPSATPTAAGGITAIGDSVILDAAPYLTELLPGIRIDGKIGRQMTEALKIVEDLKAHDKLGKTVVIELGTNGAFSNKQLHALLDSIGDKHRVILVNARVPKPWQNAVNDLLKEAVAEYPNAELLDWYRASAGKSEIFYKDGVHLKPGGSELYAKLVAQAVRSEQQ